MGLGAKLRRWAPLTRETRKGIKRVQYNEDLIFFDFFMIKAAKGFEFDSMHTFSGGLRVRCRSRTELKPKAPHKGAPTSRS